MRAKTQMARRIDGRCDPGHGLGRTNRVAGLAASVLNGAF